MHTIPLSTREFLRAQLDDVLPKTLPELIAILESTPKEIDAILGVFRVLQAHITIYEEEHGPL